jgi:hypothetical protein
MLNVSSSGPRPWLEMGATHIRKRYSHQQQYRGNGPGHWQYLGGGYVIPNDHKSAVGRHGKYGQQTNEYRNYCK